MLTRDNFDPLLTPQFFSLPADSAAHELATLTFPTPPSADELATFFNSPAAAEFYQGAQALSQRLAAWATTHHITPQESSVQEILDSFHETNFTISATALATAGAAHRNDLFRLYTKGLQLLATTLQLLEDPSIPLVVRQHTVTALFDGLICSPGAYTNFYNACLELQSDPSMQLLEIRRHIAGQVANKFIHKLGLISGHEGDDIHYVNSVLNYYADWLALTPIDDMFAPQHIEELQPLFIAFKEQIGSVLTVEAILEQLIAKLNLDSLAQGIAVPDTTNAALDAFEKILNEYGVDPQYNRLHLVDPDHPDHLRIDVHTHLMITLLHRLASRGYLHLTPEEKVTPFGKIYLIPHHSLQLAYVVDQYNARTPLISYYIEQAYAGQEDILRVLTVAQRQEANLALLHHVLMEGQQHAKEQEWRDKLITLLKNKVVMSSLMEQPVAPLLNIFHTLPRDNPQWQQAMTIVLRQYKIPQHLNTSQELARYIMLLKPSIQVGAFRKHKDCIIGKDPIKFRDFLQALSEFSTLPGFDELLTRITRKHTKTRLTTAAQLSALVKGLPAQAQAVFLRSLDIDYAAKLLLTTSDYASMLNSFPLNYSAELMLKNCDTVQFTFIGQFTEYFVPLFHLLTPQGRTNLMYLAQDSLFDEKSFRGLSIHWYMRQLPEPERFYFIATLTNEILERYIANMDTLVQLLQLLPTYSARVNCLKRLTGPHLVKLIPDLAELNKLNEVLTGNEMLTVMNLIGAVHLRTLIPSPLAFAPLLARITTPVNQWLCLDQLIQNLVFTKAKLFETLETFVAILKALDPSLRHLFFNEIDQHQLRLLINTAPALKQVMQTLAGMQRLDLLKLLDPLFLFRLNERRELEEIIASVDIPDNERQLLTHFTEQLQITWAIQQGLRMKNLIDNFYKMFKGHGIFPHETLN